MCIVNTTCERTCCIELICRACSCYFYICTLNNRETDRNPIDIMENNEKHKIFELKKHKEKYIHKDINIISTCVKGFFYKTLNQFL